MFKKTLFNKALLYLLPAALVFAAASARAEDRQTVNIGLIFPLSGPMAAFGADIAHAAPLLEQRFNQEQAKYLFKLILEDGKFGQGNAAITAAKKLVETAGVRFIVAGSSGEILQISSYLEGAHVIGVAGFASHPAVKAAGDFIFRTYIDAGRGIPFVAQDIRRRGFDRVALITEVSSFTTAIADSLRQNLGQDIAVDEEISFGEAGFNSVIAKARAANPQAYYINVATPANFTTLVAQLRSNGVDAPFYTYYTPSLKDVQQSLGRLLERTSYLDFPDTPDTSEDFKEFFTEYSKLKGKEVNAPFNFKTNYNAIKVLVDCIVEAGPDPTLVKNLLYSYDRPSATGRLRFDENGDVRDLNLVLKQVNSAQAD